MVIFHGFLYVYQAGYLAGKPQFSSENLCHLAKHGAGGAKSPHIQLRKVRLEGLKDLHRPFLRMLP